VDKATFNEIRELMELNAQQAVEIVQRIVDGKIAARPVDKGECRTCPFISVCRIKEQQPPS
jgi:ATP-dependent helicase/DNAse subunit B